VPRCLYIPRVDRNGSGRFSCAHHDGGHSGCAPAYAFSLSYLVLRTYEMATTARSRALFWSLFFFGYIDFALAQTGYIYQLDTEYAGANFFSGWNFFTASAGGHYLVAGANLVLRAVIQPEAT
jgi:hypothetical protein